MRWLWRKASKCAARDDIPVAGRDSDDLHFLDPYEDRGASSERLRTGIGEHGQQIGRAAHLSLLLPGAAPTERGRAPARRSSTTPPMRSLPNFAPEAEQRLPRTRRAAVARGVSDSSGARRDRQAWCGTSTAMICAGPLGAEGRGPVVGPEAERGAAQMIATAPHFRESVWKPASTVSPAQPRQEGGPRSKSLFFGRATEWRIAICQSDCKLVRAQTQPRAFTSRRPEYP